MRKRLLGLVFVLFALCLPRVSQAQTWQQFYGIITTPCTGITLTGPNTGVPTYAWCIDTATGALYYQGTSGWTAIGNGSATAKEFSISSGSNTFGLTTAYPTNTVIASYKAVNAGHFTQLNCVNNGLGGGSCTTAPTVNVFDGSSNTGTAVTCSTTAQTKGTQTTQAQTQTFAAGDIIGIYISTQGGTCVAPLFTVTTSATTP